MTTSIHAHANDHLSYTLAAGVFKAASCATYALLRGACHGAVTAYTRGDFVEGFVFGTVVATVEGVAAQVLGNPPSSKEWFAIEALGNGVVGIGMKLLGKNVSTLFTEGTTIAVSGVSLAALHALGSELLVGCSSSTQVNKKE